MGSLNDYYRQARHKADRQRSELDAARVRTSDRARQQETRLSELEQELSGEISRFLSAMKRRGNPGSRRTGLLAIQRTWTLASEPFDGDYNFSAGHPVGISTRGRIVWLEGSTIVNSPESHMMWLPTADSLRHGMATQLAEHDVRL
jgi:hypothetical protein